MRIAAILFLAPCLLAQGKPPVLRGPWLGQMPPGNEARLFAPGFVSTGLYTRDLAMTPDGKEFYFTITLGRFKYTKILVTRQQPDGTWTEPEVAPFCAPGGHDVEPHISPDGRRFLFVSDRPDPANGRTEKNFDVWIMDRTPQGWSAPRNLGSPISTEQEEFFPSLTQDGTLYFTRRPKGGDDEIFAAQPDGKGGFLAPQKLPPQVNSGEARFNACVSPDGAYMVVPTYGRKDSLGSTDYYACFRKEGGTWSEAANLGRAVNTASGEEYSPFVTADGRFLFFMSMRPETPREAFGQERSYRRIQELHREPGAANPAMYWISTSILQTLKSR